MNQVLCLVVTPKLSAWDSAHAKQRGATLFLKKLQFSSQKQNECPLRYVNGYIFSRNNSHFDASVD